jgi:antitoxin YqcF
MHLGACFYDHFVRFLGEPARVSIFRAAEDEPSLQILEYDRVFPGCRVFCSLGLTHYNPELQSICEVFLPVDDAWDEIPSLLANALNYMTKKPIRLRRGSVLSGVENISPPFAARFDKHALYFSTPFGMPDAFAVVDCETISGNVYLAAFISQAEYEYLVSHGPEQLETLLEAGNVDPFQLQRASCI